MRPVVPLIQLHTEAATMRMKRQTGFTLIEIAVVIFLIGLLATMGLSALKSQLANAAISATKKKQEIIKDALVSYIAKFKRLPCPAINETGGLDATLRTAGIPPPNCISNFGIVPYAELGLPKSAALDGWDNFFTYAVTPSWTATLVHTMVLACVPATYNGSNKTCDSSKAFNVGNLGTLTINDRLPASQITPTKIADPTATPPTGAAAVLISHGVNGSGAYTNKGTQNAAPSGFDEIANALGQNTLPLTVPFPVNGFFQRVYTDSDDGFGAFDDILTWLTPNDLVYPLVKDRVIQSAYGQFSDQISSIRAWSVGFMLSSGCAAPTENNFPANLATDPWGNKISSSAGDPFYYNRSSLAFGCVLNPATPIYTIINIPANQTISGPTCLEYQYLQTKCP
jgi:prepilin-type N-terminal cleavage/methylation domain-containing protein